MEVCLKLLASLIAWTSIRERAEKFSSSNELGELESEAARCWQANFLIIEHYLSKINQRTFHHFHLTSVSKLNNRSAL